MNPFVARPYGKAVSVAIDSNLVEPCQVNGDAAANIRCASKCPMSTRLDCEGTADLAGNDDGGCNIL